LEDRANLEKILKEGSEKAREIAASNMKEIKKLVGMMN